MRTATKAESFSISASAALISCLSILAAASAAATATGTTRSLDGDYSSSVVESRFVVRISLLQILGGSSPFPSPVDISCGAGTVPVVLEEENFGLFSPRDCAAIDDRSLRCADLPVSVQGYGDGSGGLESAVAIACRGNGSSDNPDFDFLEVTLPATTYSADPFGSVTRALYVERICDPPRIDGLLRSKHYWPNPRPDFNAICKLGGGGLANSMGVCTFAHICSNSFGAPCRDDPIDELSVAVHSYFNVGEGDGTCLYTTEPEPVPELNGVYKADYKLDIGFNPYMPSCMSEKGTIEVTCENGGDLSLATPSNLCQRKGASQLVCNLGEYNAASGYISCTGTSLHQLALTATWVPDENGLQCTDPNGMLVRAFALRQACIPEIFQTLPGPIVDLSSSFDIASTCFPLVSTYVDVIVKEFVDGRTGETVKVDSYPYEECAKVDLSCFPYCGEGAPQMPLKISILPQHIRAECLTLTDSNAVNDNDNVAGGAGVAGNGDGNGNGNGSGDEIEGNEGTRGGAAQNGNGIAPVNITVHGPGSSASKQFLTGCASQILAGVVFVSLFI